MEYVLFRQPRQPMPPLADLNRVLGGLKPWERLLKGETIELSLETAKALAELLPNLLYSVEQAKAVAPRLFLGAPGETMFVHFRGREVYIPSIPHAGNWAVYRLTTDPRLWRAGSASVYTTYDPYGVLCGLIGATDQVDAEICRFFEDGEKMFPVLKETFEATPFPRREQEWYALKRYAPLRGDSPEAYYWRAHIVWRARQIVCLLNDEGQAGYADVDDPESGNVNYLDALKYKRVLEAYNGG